ncbi:Y-family DNA polymerase [Kangiella sediminilitoris]|uniref:DNA-directed DNA polymerase n=1 Tax=Kangiella sediminilitoris TaxID=1144748 RepID=A0A1B3BAC0_9GAMM|nr:Y-family DNA polymerase [Kangiella sediminilitoris]AOE49752.1 DNA-directed DNA polymerase [Kangiella sediminilitoris]
MSESTYALCDVNSFYVACERLFRPDLQNKPVIVLSNNDGCAIAMCDRSKSLGIKMGAPYFQIQSLVKKHRIECFSSNYGLYGDISQRFNWVLNQFADKVSPYSVDESFLKLDGFNNDLTEYCRTLKDTVNEWLSLPICIGLGPTKTLAKVANHYAKKHKVSTHGVVDLSNTRHREWALRRMRVDQVWGIGRRLSQKLRLHGINSAWELHNAEYKTLQRMFSVNMERTILELRGQPCLAFDELPQPKQSILNSRSFGNTITEYKDLKEALAYHATRCCEKLRLQSSLASSIQLFLYTRDGQHLSKTLTFTEPNDDTSLFLKAIELGLQGIYRKGCHYKKAGVTLLGLVPSKGYQSDIFNKAPQRPELMSSLDSINAKYGQDTIKFGSLGFAKRWAMRCNSRSPRYTSRWSDVIQVK